MLIFFIYYQLKSRLWWNSLPLKTDSIKSIRNSKISKWCGYFWRPQTYPSVLNQNQKWNLRSVCNLAKIISYFLKPKNYQSQWPDLRSDHEDCWYTMSVKTADTQCQLNSSPSYVLVNIKVLKKMFYRHWIQSSMLRGWIWS